MAAILLCGSAASMQAQKYYNTKHEFGISIGSASNSQIIDAMEDFTKVIVTNTVTFGTVSPTYENKSDFPTLSIDYYYHVSKVIGLGGIFSFNSRSQDIYVSGSKYGDAKRTTFSLIPTVKFDWLRKKNIGLYSKVGFGLSLLSDTQKENDGDKLLEETRLYTNFQLSLIGFEFGSEKLRGFAELGVGEQGAAVLGIRYKM